MKISQYLEKAAKFLEKHRWTRGKMAKDKYGVGCDPLSKSADCFCLYGALLRVGGREKHNVSEQRVLIDNKFRECFGHKITTFNDSYARDKQEAVRAFHKLAKIFKAEGK